MSNFVYMVWFDNQEPYEDWFVYPESIFKTWDEAEKYIKDNYPNYIKSMELDWIWPMGEDCIHINRPIWKITDKYSRNSYYIRMWDLDTGKEVIFDNEHIFEVEKDND